MSMVQLYTGNSGECAESLFNLSSIEHNIFNISKVLQRDVTRVLVRLVKFSVFASGKVS